MSHADFVHLRVHSAYSLSEGAVRIKQLTARCRKLGMPAVAVTDSNNLFGAMEFSKECAAAGVQPILGCELALQRQDMEGADRIVLLVQNEIGYHNLLKLVSKAFLDSPDPTEPQISLADLAPRGAGLILLTGGAAGPIGRLLATGQGDKAQVLLQDLVGIFPGACYVEISRHGVDAERLSEGGLIDLAYDLDLPLVATNAAYFLDEEEYDAHDALICIAAGAYLSESERRRLTPDHRLKTPAEMRALFSDLPEAIENTLVIARRCAFMLEFVKPILPPYDTGDGRDEEAELRHQAARGLEKRLNAQVYTGEMDAAARAATAKPYEDRLAYELDVIVQMGFPGYFLIVADFIQWSKEQGIPVGPGRGSGAGSVVAWALTITDLDPLRFGLLFERFLNPERVSMPDFDIDFCQDRRDEVIHYVQDKYGRDKVAQIITFGKLQARAVLRDVGRVLEMPYGQVDRICKLVPNNPAKPVTLRQAVDGEPQLKSMIREDDTVARLVEIGLSLEGLYRHASTHAAGVVIGDRPLDELVPLYRDPRSDMPVTQFNMKFVESAGLVKFDFLGLKTLTVLANAVALIGDPDLDLSHLPFDDPATFEMLGKGHTVGVFQLESAGMRDVLRSMKPDSLEDLIAVVALYRPGPMDNIPSYIRRKHGEEQPDYLYPTLEPILKETHGIMIYQEQVMQIAQELSGYSLGGADLLRRAMGKKIQEEMDKQKVIFTDGAEARGVPRAKAEDIFELVAKFANYGFNKSHAAAYALVAYQTAWLKANYPVQFLAASMTLDINNTDKLNVFRQELDRQGIAVLPPDINRSQVVFSVETDGEGKLAVRYALAAIKNVGAAAMRALVQTREETGPFKDLSDFALRIDPHLINKRQMENLARAGAFDGLEPNRRKVHDGVETLLRHAAAAAADRASDQIGLFGGADADSQPAIKLPNVPEWAMMDRLREELGAVGFYLSAHPLDAYGVSLRRLNVVSIAELTRQGQSGPARMAGTVISKKERTSGKGNRFAFVQLSDATGMYEVTLFSELLSAHRDRLEPGNNLFLKVSASFDGDSVRLTANDLDSLDEVSAKTAAGLEILIDSELAVRPLVETIERGRRGRGEIRLMVNLAPDQQAVLLLKNTYAVSADLLQSLKSIAGVADVREI
ncbi:MAG: DNA polymerase III subunit alpha [Magnetospiraceae bacterium]